MAYIFNGKEDYNGLEIAVIGMAGRFPGARTIQEFWQMLVENREAITFFKDAVLDDPFFTPDIAGSPDYIKARGILEDVECFDAGLFGYNPGEARLLDPQVRFFHECSWEALEDAGYNPYGYPGLIGVFAGANNNAFWQISGMLKHNDRDFSNKDFLSSRLSYKLNLKGPSQTIFSACSTSLMAVHMACRSLLSGECSLAIAGGVSIDMPQSRGYLYTHEGILSSSGHNRSFDAQADGTVFSNGIGVVVLKLLEDAIKDNDNIHAVIKGSAINNDGDRKVSFTAPSVQGQMEVVRDALAFSGVEPASIRYIETHGSATAMGDPIEVEALKRVFTSGKPGSCGLGSVKSNIGHTNAAAGVAGLLKTILSMKHRIIPASINFKTLNPNINFEDSPFYIASGNKSLAADTSTLRMGVTSLGVGGSNAHIILEEAPVWQETITARSYGILTFSAKTDQALKDQVKRFEAWSGEQGLPGLASTAYTLNTGRANFAYRATAIAAKSSVTGGGLHLSHLEYNTLDTRTKPVVVFIFPGSRYYYQGLGKGLYREEPVFSEALNLCFDICKEVVSNDLRPVFDGPDDIRMTSAQETSSVLRAIAFSIQYALAKYLTSLGIMPDLVLSHTGDHIASSVVPAEDDLAGIFRKIFDPSEEDMTTAQHTTIDNVLDDRRCLLVFIGADAETTEAYSKHEKYNESLHAIINPLRGRDPGQDESLLFTRQLGRLWLWGLQPDWEAYYKHENKRKVSLPTYCFEKKQYKIEGIKLSDIYSRGEDGPARSGDAMEWLYYPSWKISAIPFEEDKPFYAKECWVIFTFPDNSLAGALCTTLKANGQKVTLVYPGESFEEKDDIFTIDITSVHDYDTVFDRLQQKSCYPHRVIHLWNISYMGDGDKGSFEYAQHFGYHSLIYLSQALGHTGGINQVSVSVVSSFIQQVSGMEKTDRAKATLLGPLSAVPHENIWLAFKSIDLDTHTPRNAEQMGNILIGETINIHNDTSIAYRNGRRWVLHYEKYIPGEPDFSKLPHFREDGVYVILGGLGNIGIHIAGYIAQKIKANLVLVGRRPFPGEDYREDIQDDASVEIKEKLSMIRDMERRGSRVVIRTADAGNEEAMYALWKELITAYGRIDGVIHSAGILNSASNVCTVDMLTKTHAEEHFYAKVYGLYLLEALFRQYGAPDFCLLMSSLATVLGGIGFSAYSAANNFMDHFGRSDVYGKVTRWKAMNWDAWQFEYAKSTKEAHDYQMAFAMPTEDALKAFHAGLYLNGVDQVIISTGDIAARLAKYRKLLAARDASGVASSKARTDKDYEKGLLEIWRKHLGHQQMGVDDDFFQLGGNSFLLITLLNDIRISFGKKISIKAFYQNPRISALVPLLKAGQDVSMPALRPAEKKEYYVLSAAQKRMYYQHALQPDGTNYNETKIFEMGTWPDIDRLKTAWTEIIRRHESLRTSFVVVDGEPMQLIHDEITFDIDILDHAGDDILDFVRSYIRPFDLAASPLLRIAVVRTGTGKQYFVSDFHHIIFDAVSMHIMKDELMALYEGRRLPPVKWQYKDMSELFASPPYIAEQLRLRQFWINTLKGFSGATVLPHDPLPEMELTMEDRYAQKTILGEELTMINDFIKDKNITLFPFMLAVLSTLLSKYTGNDDTVVGVTVSGRTQADMNAIVGMFVNILPLRCHPESEKSFDQFLREVRQINSEMLYYQDYPYNALVNDIRYEFGIDTPIFHIVFNMVSDIVDGRDEEDNGLLTKEVLFTENRTSKYNFIINVTQSTHEINIGINYSARHYLADTISRLLDNYHAVIQFVLQHADACLRDIQIGSVYEELSFDGEMLNQEFNFI